jgi:hypothetical protein
MLQYVITVKETQEGLSFIEFVKSLNFVTNIELVQFEEDANRVEEKFIPFPKKNGDFFELAGIWKDYNINIDQIRAKAWPPRK